MIKKLLALTTALITLNSCTPSTPQARIQQDPIGFSKLNPKHQQLVEQGRIEKGMDKKAVYFAWGNPNAKITGSRNGTDFQRWNYVSYTPVYTNSIYSGYGYGFGRGRYHRHPYSSFGVQPEVNYIPQNSGFVEFRREKVTNWERRQ